MKKGFTLIELLAVIVILAIIALIATPIVLNIINDSKESATLRNSDFYLEGVETSIATSVLKGITISDGSYPIMEDGNLCIGKLSNNICTGEILKVEMDGEVPSSGSITFEDGKVTSVSLTYANGTVTLNNKGELILGESKEPEEKSICKLVENGDVAPAGISAGDKYQCKVKDDMETGFEGGYYFFVLGTNNDGTTNLIMERNMYYDSTNDVGMVATETNKGLVAWYASASNHSYGPVTAMNYLHNATKDWDNVPNMIINYHDENIDYSTQQKGTNGYGSIKTTDNITIITSKNNEETGRIENLKVRMPRYDEVHGTGKCLTYAENGNQYGSCPLWLSNYLNSSSYVTGEGLQNISGISGYWTLSSRANGSNSVCIVLSGGFMHYHSTSYVHSYGVRPVITLEI